MLIVRRHSYWTSSLLLNLLIDYFRREKCLINITYPVSCGRYGIFHWPDHICAILFYVLFLVLSKDYFQKSIYKKKRKSTYLFSEISLGKENGIKFGKMIMTIQVETTSRITLYFVVFSEK